MRSAFLLVVASLLAAGCTCGGPPLIPSDGSPDPLDASTPDASPDAGEEDSGAMDAGPDTGPVDAGPIPEDAACTSATVEAEVERLPVDIIWVIDNSASMAAAIEQVQLGLNDFAALISARDLDYRVIMLSLRGQGTTSTGLYQVCIPPPLAGDSTCGDGPRFFQVNVDIRSTQPLEQFLGTLGQTAGYRGGGIGSAPWRSLLRDGATKTIVVVTDDNARMVVNDGSGGFEAGTTTSDPVATADWFEHNRMAAHPFASTRDLPPGILEPHWGGIFEGYTFSALYGWGSETDPSVICSFPGGGTPPAASGLTYTELVRRTSGVRAQICAGAAAWGPFFDDIATTVDRRSRIDCEIPIPPAPEGQVFERDRINVLLNDGESATLIGKVLTAGDCDARGGWHYDNESAPTAVVLCPISCEAAQPTTDVATGVNVRFGCQTMLM